MSRDHHAFKYTFIVTFLSLQIEHSWWLMREFELNVSIQIQIETELEVVIASIYQK